MSAHYWIEAIVCSISYLSAQNMYIIAFSAG